MSATQFKTLRKLLSRLKKALGREPTFDEFRKAMKGEHMKGTLLLDLALVSLMIFFLLTGGFFLGKWYQDTLVKKYLPQTMQGMCEECRAGGEQTGLDTCRDLLKDADNNNY